jgi:hypothetical protein
MSKETADHMVVGISEERLHVAAIIMGHIAKVSFEHPRRQEDVWKIIEIWWDMYSNSQKLSQDDPQSREGFFAGFFAGFLPYILNETL